MYYPYESGKQWLIAKIKLKIYYNIFEAAKDPTLSTYFGCRDIIKIPKKKLGINLTAFQVLVIYIYTRIIINYDII